MLIYFTKIYRFKLFQQFISNLNNFILFISVIIKYKTKFIDNRKVFILFFKKQLDIPYLL